MAAKHHKPLSEEDALAIVLKDHPEWRKPWEDGTLPEEMIGDDGQPMSPVLHIVMHTVVERQLAADQPEGVVAIAQELENLGHSRHEIRHAIGEAVANELWQMNKDGCAFDDRRYLADLRKMIDSRRWDRDAD